jgi:hypothetical protein
MDKQKFPFLPTFLLEEKQKNASNSLRSLAGRTRPPTTKNHGNDNEKKAHQRIRKHLQSFIL